MEWHVWMDGAMFLGTLVGLFAVLRYKRWSQLVFVGTGAWFTFSEWFFDDNQPLACLTAAMTCLSLVAWCYWDRLMGVEPTPQPAYRTEKIGDTWVIYDGDTEEILGWSRTEPTEAWLRGEEDKAKPA